MMIPSISAMTAAARVSYLRCPYGWSASGGLPAMRRPINAMTFDAPSVSEWKPSERMLTAPLVYPNTIFATATIRLRKKMRTRTRRTSRYRAWDATIGDWVIGDLVIGWRLEIGDWR